MSEEAKPIKKALVDRAREFGIEKIELRFSGGSDEGFLQVILEPKGLSGTSNLEKDIEDWAWSAYEYSGAGDGSDYGDTITYDLKNRTVTTQAWSMQRTEEAPESSKLYECEK